MIEDFLSWIEYKKYSVSTRNLRLAALHAFFRYVQLESPEYMGLCSSILAIKSKKTPVTEMNYLSTEGIKSLLSMPDTSLKRGRRDLAVLTMMYDTGARVQEIADLKVADVRINVPATVTPAVNSTMEFQLTSDTQLTIKVKGTDGTVRSANITLA